MKTVVLGTGGTIAGLSMDESNPKNYRASQLGLTDILVQAGIHTDQLDMQDVAQIDSKDMGPAVWKPLLRAILGAQNREDVQAVVITHGTDTIEETAFLIELLGPWAKPVVLTCAMQPSDSPTADGPGNLRDALMLAKDARFNGVAVVCAGKAHHPLFLQKIRTDIDDAFSSGLSKPWAQIQDGQWLISGLQAPIFNQMNPHKTPVWRVSDPFSTGQIWPGELPMPDVPFFLSSSEWPRVEWVTNHAASEGELVMALLEGAAGATRPVRGLVVAATGSGTVSQGLEHALSKAKAAGVEVWVSSRCVWGESRFYEEKPWGVATHLNPAKAMVALSLSLLAASTHA